MKRNLLLSLLACLIALTSVFALVACTESGDDTNTGFTLSATQIEMSVGEKKNLTLNYSVEGTVEVKAEDEEIVSVRLVGKLLMLNALKEGETNVTATLGELKASCKVVVTAAETVTISNGETNLTEGQTVDVLAGETLTLTATASKGSAIKWSSSNDAVASVDSGVITANKPGQAVVTAYVDETFKATVTVNVTLPEGEEYYDLQFAAEGAETAEDGTAIVADKFFYWSARAMWGQQEVVVDYAYFRNGTLKFKYTSEDAFGYHYGFQLFYKNSQQTIGKAYKLTCKITVAEACTVSLNGNVITLNAGANDVEVYFVYTDGISSFDLVMGYADGSEKGVWVQNAEVTIANVEWEEITQIKLAAPSMEYDAETGIITINDTNTEGVAGYRLNLYQDGAMKGSVTVENGNAIDTSKIANGEYTAKIVALASSARYLDSDVSENSITIVVENQSVQYDLEFKGETEAVNFPGTWYYWRESWVQFEGNYKDGVVTATFSNNAGNWYDTQLFYEMPGEENGATYEITLKISAPNEGRVTISGTVITLLEGQHEYKVTVKGGSGATLVIVFGVNGESAQQEIQSGTVTLEITNVEKTAEGQPETPDQPGETEYEDGETYNAAYETLVNGDEANMAENVWTYWYVQDTSWNCGDVVTMTANTLEEGVI
ncbi:MAG: Ig-like domain-containing protein, partial [Clostridia bacterium]|nr:Ig-like domain-containing protein [Clostridia bacterium]